MICVSPFNKKEKQGEGLLRTSAVTFPKIDVFFKNQL